MATTAESIRARARSLGFELCGIAPASLLPELLRLRPWLDRGYGGGMTYLRASARVREDIREFLPAARSVIVTGTLYYTDSTARERNEDPAPNGSDVSGAKVLPQHSEGPARIARYAQGRDYHAVLAERLASLLEWMRVVHDRPFDARIFVDKHPVQERVFAYYAGLGWIGKHTLLINEQLGSWLFLSGLVTSLELPADEPVADRCGACTLCIDACPTGALVDERELDATKCISYLTIENDDAIAEEQRAGIGDHVFGCDECQSVCPWNLAPLATLDPAWQRRSVLEDDPKALWQRSDFELHETIAGSAMTRVSVSRLRRNLAVALGNSHDPHAAAVLDRPGGGVPRAAQSADTPLVREHVEWAKRQLARTRSTMHV